MVGNFNNDVSNEKSLQIIINEDDQIIDISENSKFNKKQTRRSSSISTQAIDFVESPENFTVQYNSIGNFINWNVTFTGAGDKTFEMFRNNSIHLTGGWQGKTSNVTSNIDGLELGIYNFTLILYEASTPEGHPPYTVWVTVDDTEAPKFNNPVETYQYEKDTVNHSLIWNITEYNPKNYTIFKNETSVFNDTTWSNTALITIEIDDLAPDPYNYTIQAFDQFDNSTSNTIMVTVHDQADPIFLGSANDLSFNESDLDNVLQWNVSDLSPSTYTINVSSSAWEIVGIWKNKVNITLNVDSFLHGDHEFTITVEDQLGNTKQDSVNVVIRDYLSPAIIAGPNPNYYYEEGSTGNILEWNITDNHAFNYTIVHNSSLSIDPSLEWISGINITLNIDQLLPGAYYFNVTVFDKYSNFVIDNITLTVLPNSPVQINASPNDLIMEENSTDNFLHWNATDNSPSYYELKFENGSIFDTGSWNDLANISINLDGRLLQGVYNLTIFIYDDAGNFNTSSVWVTVYDATNPTFSTEPTPFPYEESSQNKTLNWLVNDNHPNYYEIFVNSTINPIPTGLGILIATGNWTNFVNITLNIDGALSGIYNYTVVVYDLSGNFFSSNVIITVFDLTKPVIDSSLISTTLLELDENILHWKITENHPKNYTIFIDGVSIFNGTGSTDISYNISGLELGTYNVTLLIYDEVGNYGNSSLNITIIDGTLPQFNSIPTSPYYIEGVTEFTLYWNVTDKHANPGEYYLYHNLGLLTTGNWTTISNISLEITGLPKGNHNYTIIVFDKNNNSNSHTIFVEVLDETAPELTHLTDISLIFNSTGEQFSWTLTDLHPSIYIIYRNGSQIETNPWASNTPISVTLNDLMVAVYNFTIIIFDDSGNYDTDVVIVTVLPISTLVPSIEIQTQVYEGDIDKIIGIWQSNTSIGLSNADVIAKLYKNNQLGRTISNITNPEGFFEISLSYENILEGSYLWVISFSKSGYLSREINLPVTVLPHTLSITYEADDSLTQNEEYSVTVTVVYNNQENANLYLNTIGRSGGVTNLKINLIFSGDFSDETPFNIIKSGFTNSSGIVIISLSSSETASISLLSGVTIEIDDERFPNQEDIILNSNELPEIIKNGSSEISNLFDVREMVKRIEFQIIILIIGIIISAFILLRIYKYLIFDFDQKGKENLEEINGLSSLRAFIIHSKINHQPFYEERFTSLETDSILLAGLITAITAFLDELDTKQQTGVQTMERQGLSLTSHTSRISTFTVVSNGTLTKNLLDKIIKIHNRVENSYEKEISKPVVSVEDYDTSIFDVIFDDENLKLHLLRGVLLDKEMLNKSLRGRFEFIKRKSNQMLLANLQNIPEELLNNLNLNTVKRFLIVESGLSPEDAAHTIILAYERSILRAKTIAENIMAIT